MSTDWGKILIWGLGATIVLTTIMSLSRPLKLTRMDIPFMLGTMFTPDRYRARWIGFGLHIMIGWMFAFLYAAAFETLGETSVFSQWWFGALIGLVHGAFVLVVGLMLISTMHPRMATEGHGPDPTRQLEPPGFLAVNYGSGTPIVSMLAHIVYGGILGIFY